jgi:hypothetical protein
MINLDIQGTLGKFGYHNLPDDIADSILKIATDTAYKTAVQKAPWDPEPDGIHIKEDLKTYYSPMLKTGFVFIRSPYANIAEFGSRKRLAHPYMRPASKAARNKMKAVIRVSTKDAVDKEKAHGNS